MGKNVAYQEFLPFLRFFFRTIL